MGNTAIERRTAAPAGSSEAGVRLDATTIPIVAKTSEHARRDADLPRAKAIRGVPGVRGTAATRTWCGVAVEVRRRRLALWDVHNLDRRRRRCNGRKRSADQRDLGPGIAQPHGGREAITAARHGLNRTLTFEIRIEDLAERRDVVRDAAFFDEGIGPHPLEELLLGDHPTRFLDQDEQDFESLWRQRDVFEALGRRRGAGFDTGRGSRRRVETARIRRNRRSLVVRAGPDAISGVACHRISA